jgi:hypothetical protein
MLLYRQKDKGLKSLTYNHLPHREYQTGQKVAFKDTEDGVWVKGEITGIYHDNDLDYEILEIDDGMYYITHEGHAPIIII